MDEETKGVTTKDASMRRNVFTKAFSGELPLWVTFWFFGLAAIKTINFFVAHIYNDKNAFFWASFIEQHGVPIYMALAGMIALVAILYKAAIIRGIWISAGKYTGTQAWAYFAKFFMILWVIGLMSETLETIAIFREQNTAVSFSPLSRIDRYAEIVGELIR